VKYRALREEIQFGGRPAGISARFLLAGAVAAVAGSQCGQAGSFDQFHRIEVRAVVLAGGVDGNDVGVVQLGRGFGFALEADHRFARESERCGEQLQRDFAIERDLPGFVHDAHATAAEFAQDFEVAESAMVRSVGRRRDTASAVERGGRSGLIVAIANQRIRPWDLI
jgi:hypothetical protein